MAEDMLEVGGCVRGGSWSCDGVGDGVGASVVGAASLHLHQTSTSRCRQSRREIIILSDNLNVLCKLIELN